jgi:hypothetical protein
MVVRDIREGSIHKEDFVRSTIVITLVFALSACSLLDQLDFNGSGLDPNKIYLDQTNIVSVAARETHHYACIYGPLLCVQRGIDLECRCP